MEIQDDMEEHYGYLPVETMSTEELLKNYTTGDERTWDEEANDIDYMRQVESIRKYGQRYPITLGDDGRVLDGHHRVLAARYLGMPTVKVRHFKGV